jgi:adenylyltransferase/sulfurtransferase
MFETANVEISAADVKRKLDQGETLTLLDVREPKEVAICKIPNSIHIPIRELQQRLDELEPYKDKTIVVYCHLGGRSIQCVQFMRQHGYTALNLTGGTEAWSNEVDPTMAKY